MYTLTGIYLFIAGCCMFTSTSIYDVIYDHTNWELWMLAGGNVSFLAGSGLFLLGYYKDPDDYPDCGHIATPDKLNGVTSIAPIPPLQLKGELNV